MHSEGRTLISLLICSLISDKNTIIPKLQFCAFPLEISASSLPTCLFPSHAHLFWLLSLAQWFSLSCSHFSSYCLGHGHSGLQPLRWSDFLDSQTTPPMSREETGSTAHVWAYIPRDPDISSRALQLSSCLFLSVTGTCRLLWLQGTAHTSSTSNPTASTPNP